MAARRRLFSLLAIPLAFTSSLAVAADKGPDEIGFYTAILGQVGVTHPHDDRVLPVKLHGEVLFKDIIQTQRESRTRALFQDDSMLTVGENSRVEIDEYIYNPEKNVRQAIVKLMQGQVRALVSKVFKANGSRFEIHTPSAVAAARGTYFTVWVENGQSGIINIGERGRVDFTSGGKTVAVDPGYFSVAHEGQVPSAPLPHQLGLKSPDPSAAAVSSIEKMASAPATIHDQGSNILPSIKPTELTPVSSVTELARALMAVELTSLREAPLVELPGQVLQALNVDTVLMKALATLTGRSTESLGIIGRGTTAGTTGIVTVAPLTTGSASVGSTAVAPVTSALAAPVASITSTVVAPSTAIIAPIVAPVTSVVTTVTAPVAPIIAPIVAPVIPVVTTVTAPVAPIIAPVIAPVAPLVTTILTIP